MKLLETMSNPLVRFRGAFRVLFSPACVPQTQLISGLPTSADRAGFRGYCDLRSALVLLYHQNRVDHLLEAEDSAVKAVLKICRAQVTREDPPMKPLRTGLQRLC